jgi:hypothetical protein
LGNQTSSTKVDKIFVIKRLARRICKRANRPELEKALAAARLDRASLVVSKVGRRTRSFVPSRLLEAALMSVCRSSQIEGPKRGHAAYCWA